MRVVDGLDAHALEVELATMLEADAEMSLALLITLEAADVSLSLADGAQLEVASRPFESPPGRLPERYCSGVEVTG